MVSAKLFAVAAFVAGAVASPIATSSKNFKIGVTFAGNKVYYLTSTTKSSANAADAVECSLTNGAIACGADKAGLTYNEIHSFFPLSPTVSAPSNRGFSIDADNSLHWQSAKPGKEVHFSQMMGAGTDLFAEICTSYSHPDAVMFTPGVAKVYYD